MGGTAALGSDAGGGKPGLAGVGAARPRDELAAAVRADVAERGGALPAERALVAADRRLAVRSDRSGAALAGGSHLQGHGTRRMTDP